MAADESGRAGAIAASAPGGSKTPLPNRFRPADKVRIHGLRNGLMIYSRPTSGGRYGHWFIVAPPLIISEEDCGELLRRLEATLSDLSQELRASGDL